MGKQILNRREPIYAEEIPAEIADTSGYIEATDYATDTTGGTVKVDDAYGVELTAAGKLRGTVETAAAYAEAGNNLLVSKGTLDNVLAELPGGGGLPTFTTLFSGDADFGTLNTEAVLSDDYDKYDAIYCLFKNSSTYYVTPFFMFTQDITYGTTMNDHLIGGAVANNQAASAGMGGFWFNDKTTMKANGCPACHLIKVYGLKW